LSYFCIPAVQIYEFHMFIISKEIQ